MRKINHKKVDRHSYNERYKKRLDNIENIENLDSYICYFENKYLTPFHVGGKTKGYVRGLATQAIVTKTQSMNVPPSMVTVLDAGCGRGELSVYLGCRGFQVIGVDISEVACTRAYELAKKIGVESQCRFLAENLERLSINDSSIDFIIGHGALHHFIKYEGVPSEFFRIMKNGAEGYFADSFGENKLFHLFHDKEKMERLGDVILTKSLICEYFSDFEVEITPTDWFVMLDKFYLKVFPPNYNSLMQRLSKLHFTLDRIIPLCRLTLFLSGSIMTNIKKPYNNSSTKKL